jgi:hypothetical protein
MRITVLAVLAVLVIPTAPLSAQQSTPRPGYGAEPMAPGVTSSSLHSPAAPNLTHASREPMPRWLKWGLVGSGVGAVTFALLGRMTIDSSPNPVLQDAALGAAAGFILLGGSVALHDALCGSGSSSRRRGLC